MKKYFILGAILFLIGGMTACTENQRARTFGGDSTIALPCGQKLFDVTWKGDNLWYAEGEPSPLRW